jgi:hypothetical protein
MGFIEGGWGGGGGGGGGVLPCGFSSDIVDETSTRTQLCVNNLDSLNVPPTPAVSRPS